MHRYRDTSGSRALPPTKWKNISRLLPLYNTLKSFSVSFCVILNDKYSQTTDHFAKRLYRRRHSAFLALLLSSIRTSFVASFYLFFSSLLLWTSTSTHQYIGYAKKNYKKFTWTCDLLLVRCNTFWWFYAIKMAVQNLRKAENHFGHDSALSSAFDSVLRSTFVMDSIVCNTEYN